MRCFFDFSFFLSWKKRLRFPCPLLLYLSFSLSSLYLLRISSCFAFIWRATFDGLECEYEILDSHTVQYAPMASELEYFLFFTISSSAINFTQSQFSCFRCLGISNNLDGNTSSSSFIFDRRLWLWLCWNRFWKMFLTGSSKVANDHKMSLNLDSDSALHAR